MPIYMLMYLLIYLPKYLLRYMLIYLLKYPPRYMHNYIMFWIYITIIVHLIALTTCKAMNNNNLVIIHNMVFRSEMQKGVPHIHELRICRWTIRC